MSLASAMISFDIVETLRHQHRPEDLLAHDAHIRLDVHQHRRLRRSSRRRTARSPPTMTEAPCVAAGFDVTEHAILLFLGDQRPHLRLRVEARAELDRVRRTAHAFDASGRTPCGAHTAASPRNRPGRVEEDRVRSAADGGVEHPRPGTLSTGDLPPSSSDTRLSESVADLLMILPTWVEPVNAILSTPGCATSAAPAVSPSPVTMLTTPGGKPASMTSSPSRSAESERLLGRLEDAGAPGSECGRELPGSHGERKIPRHDLCAHADRLARRVGEELGAGDATDRVADRFAARSWSPSRAM